MEHSKRNTPQKPFSVVMKVLKLLGDHISGKQTIFFNVSVHHLETYFSYAFAKLSVHIKKILIQNIFKELSRKISLGSQSQIKMEVIRIHFGRKGLPESFMSDVLARKIEREHCRVTNPLHQITEHGDIVIIP